MRKLTQAELATNRTKLTMFIFGLRLESIASRFTGLTASLQQFTHLLEGIHHAKDIQGQDAAGNPC